MSSSHPPGANEMMWAMIMLSFSLLACLSYFLPGVLLATLFQTKAGAALKKGLKALGTVTGALAVVLIAAAFFKEWRGPR